MGNQPLPEAAGWLSGEAFREIVAVIALAYNSLPLNA
jgi:hypothetical protein